MRILIIHEVGVGIAYAHAMFSHHHPEVVVLGFEDPMVQEQIIPFRTPLEVELLLSALPTEEIKVVTSFNETYSKKMYHHPVQQLIASRGFCHRDHILRSQHPP